MMNDLFKSARSRMPAIDYVSIVRSVYGDQNALIFGAMGGAIAAWLSAYKTGSAILYVITLVVALIGALRYWDMRRFEAANVASDDADTAQYWELRATIWGGAVVLVYGVWCFVSLVYVQDPFAELASVSLTIASMVGLVARNFGLDRLVTLQAAILSVLVGSGLVLAGGVYHVGLAMLLFLMLVSFRKLAGDVRALLLKAVHGRIEATRLAAELDTALTTMPHGLCMIGSDGTVSVINAQVESTFFGNLPEDYLGRPFGDLIEGAVESGALSRRAADYLLTEVRSGEQSKLVIGLSDGRHCEVTIASRQGHSVVMLEDITERVRAHERISFMARYDGLTKLSNRTFFSEQVEARLKEYAAKNSADMVMMMIIDIDDFKHVNDTLGHLMGDQLLIEASERVRQVFGQDSVVARFGGDEFTVFQAGNIDKKTVAELAQAVLALLRVPFRLRGENIVVNASVGVVLAPGKKSSIETLLTRSDLALYKAKAGGKAQWCLFHENMDVEYRQRQRLKTELPGALSSGQLFLHYQPIIDLDTRQIVGCEALVRWAHPEFGLIPPSQFISIAEEIGIMADISRFVLVTACTQCRSWPDHTTVSVNLSATDFRTVKVEQMVGSVLDETGLESERLIVEITETALIEEQEKAAQVLGALRGLGVGVALDDFGTGYSSMSYLHAMPFSRLKIDRSFVVNVVTSGRARKLLSSIARMSHDLDLTVTVEGIETEEQLAVISRSAQVDYAQGYLFGAPLPARDISELLDRVVVPDVSFAVKGKKLAGT